ncbi:MAG: citrate synthase, partial [Candidatus Methanoperedens sp.]|nr:citrate synthase [Candidatus Methanoperedens sp.]
MAEQAKKGLEGVVVADTMTSLVDGAEGRLIYAGYKIEDLAANASFEEVVYLLWNEVLPNATQLEHLRQQIAEQAVLPDGLLNLLKAFPRDANP